MGRLFSTPAIVVPSVIVSKSAYRSPNMLRAMGYCTDLHTAKFSEQNVFGLQHRQSPSLIAEEFDSRQNLCSVSLVACYGFQSS